MNEYVWQVIMCITTAVVGWFSAKVMTKREKKQSDLELVSKSTTDLLQGIQELTKQNKDLVLELASEQSKNLELIKENKSLLQEKIDLNGKIENLEKKVAGLTAVIKKLAKNEKVDIVE
jgi:hypothetical protein